MVKPTSLWQRFKRIVINFAKFLDANRFIYVFFAFTSISDARNVISYVFETINDNKNTASDKMHLWLMTPVGIVIAAIETLFLMLIATLGSYFKETDKNPIKRYLAIAWPYIRESIKSVKNGYKVARSLVFFGVTFGAPTLLMSSLLLPLGIGLGFAYLASRIWYRYMCSERKKIQSANDLLHLWLSESENEIKQKEIEKNYALKQGLQRLVDEGKIKNITDNVSAEDLIRLIKYKQPLNLRIRCYLSSAFNGALDGMYLYAGLYALCYLIPPLAILVNVIAIFYVTLAIVKNVYEEFCFQRKLEISAYKAEKEILESIANPTETNIKRLNVVNGEIDRIENFTYAHAACESIRDGLGIYCGLTTILVFTSLFTPIPLAVLLAFIFTGMVGLIGAFSYNLYRTKQYKNGLLDEKEKRQLRDNKLPDVTEFLLRAPAAGGKQSIKEIGYVFNAFQEQNASGHYQPSSGMIMGAAIFSAVLAAVYSLKALAKGFGRDKEELNLPSASSPHFRDSMSPFSSPRSDNPLNKNSTSFIKSKLPSDTPDNSNEEPQSQPQHMPKVFSSSEPELNEITCHHKAGGSN